MSNKKDICRECPLFGNRMEQKYKGSKTASLFIIRDSSINRAKERALLTKLIKSAGISLTDVFIAPSCRCSIDTNEDSTRDINLALKQCRNFLVRAAKAIKPKLIVSMGAYALKQTMGIQKIMVNRGRFMESPDLGCMVFVTVAPDYVFRGASKNYPDMKVTDMSPKEKMPFLDFIRIREFYENDFKTTDIDTESYTEVTDFTDFLDSKLVAFDYETTGVNTYDPAVRLRSVSLSKEEGVSNTFIFNKHESPAGYKEILENPSIAKVVASRPFEEAMSKEKLGINVQGPVHDVLQMAHLLDENHYAYSLESVADTYTGIRNIKDLSEGLRTHMADASDEVLINYGGVDCLKKGTKVMLVNGKSMDINVIVAKKLEVKVLSYNYSTQQVEPKLVTGWHRNKMTDKHWLRIQPKGLRKGTKGNLGIVCTWNHKIHTADGIKLASELTAKDSILINEPALNNTQKQILWGTCLGDGYLDNRHSKKVGMRTISQHNEYVHWKALHLGGKVQLRRPVIGGLTQNNLYCLTVPYSVYKSDIYPKFYTGNRDRIISNGILNNLDPLGWATWYMDDGCFVKSNNTARIALDRYSVTDRIKVLNIVKKKWGGHPSLIQDGVTLAFNMKASVNFFNDIRDKVHPVFRYKLPVSLRATGCLVGPDLTNAGLYTQGIEKVEVYVYPHKHTRGHTKVKYCITVQDNHNFFTPFGLVSNSDATIRAFNAMKVEFNKDKALKRYYLKFILPAQDLFKDTHINGCRIDVPALRKSENEALELLGQLHQEALDQLPPAILAKHRLDKSNKDGLKLSRGALVLDYLFLDKKGLRLKPNKSYLTAKTKQPQNTEDHLKLFSHIPFVDSLLRWKKLNTVYTSYTKNLWNHITDGYVYPNIFLNTAVTGRTSIRRPPMQSIPQHSEHAYLVKRVFAAEEGWLLGARDLAQSELKIAAVMAQDKVMLHAIHNGIDLHTKTGSIVSGATVDVVTGEQRRRAKPINFGFLYGMQSSTFQKYAKSDYDTDFTLTECDDIRNAFFAKPNGYYGLPLYHKKMKSLVKAQGYVRSPLGRIRRLPNIYSDDWSLKSYAERQAINFPVQSLSSDLAIIGFFLFNQEIKSNPKFKGKVKSLFFVHDACFFTCKKELMGATMLLLQDCMDNRAAAYIKANFKYDLGYQPSSDGKIGVNWADMKEVA